MIDEAKENCEEAFGISIEMGSKRNEHWVVRDRGLIQAHEGNIQEAEEFFTASADGFRELGMEAEMAKTLLEHGRLLLKGGQVEKGKELVSEAQEIFSKSGMIKFVQDCQNTIEKFS